MARNVFLSFVEEDLQLVHLFRGQTKNPNNPLEFSDFSVKEPFNSQNAEYVKKQIRDLIIKTSVTVCLLGSTTYTSNWVKWEIMTSKDSGKGLVGVRLHNSYTDIAPTELTGAEIINWNSGQITDAIERAAKKAGY